MFEIKRFIPWLVLIVLLTGGFVIYSINRNRAAKTAVPTSQPAEIIPETEDLTNLEPSKADAQIKENLNSATQMALKWKPDAALVYHQVKLTSLTPDEGTEIYVFDSPGAKDSHFVFTISQKSKNYIRAIIPREDYLTEELLPIDSKYWKTNYVSALQLAEKKAGKDFREKNFDWSIELNLKRDEPKNWLYWAVRYKTAGGEEFSVKINSFTDEVLTLSPSI